MLSEAQQWAQFLQNISIIIAALVAIFGIDAWRREHVGKRRMELAEEILAMFYQARDVISQIRSPLGFQGEGQTRKAEPGETPAQKRGLDNAYVVFERYNKHVELFSKLYSLRYRFMAQVGKLESKPFDDLNSILHEIFGAARMLSRYWTRENDFEHQVQRDKFLKRMQDQEAIFWAGSSDPDPIERKVNAMITDIERTCQQILSSKGTLFGLLNLPLSSDRWEIGIQKIRRTFSRGH